MAEELQSLLERIQKDGIDKANDEAGKILADAEERASEIVKEAETRAAAALKKAEEDGQSFAERGKASLQQAARDVILSVGESINGTIKALVGYEVAQAMTTESLQQMLAKVVDSYCNNTTGESRIDILVPEDLQKEIADFFLSKFADAIKNGVEIKSGTGLNTGFSVSVVDQNVQHDFSGDAISDALCQLLRPYLAEIVKNSVEKA